MVSRIQNRKKSPCFLFFNFAFHKNLPVTCTVFTWAVSELPQTVTSKYKIVTRKSFEELTSRPWFVVKVIYYRPVDTISTITSNPGGHL